MSRFLGRNSQELQFGRALCRLVFLAALILSTLGMIPVQARQDVPPTGSPAGLSDPDELQTFLDGMIGAQLRDDHIPGATVSVVKDGQLFFAKGYGDCNLETGKPVNPQTSLFQIGSVGKVITTAAVLQLAEQGKVDLRADVNNYLKTFQIPATYPQPITLAHLLTHSAGFEDHITASDAPTLSDLEPLGQWLADHVPARVRPPGELTAYSNYSFALAGYVVEQVSGMPFERYADRYLFQPLHMNSSTFDQPVPAGLAAELCPSYTYRGGKYWPNSFELLQGAPRGALSTTATDMANFMIAVLQGGSFETGRILQAETAQMMLAQQFTNDLRVPGMAYGFEERTINGQHLSIKDGYIPAFSSILALLPENNVGLFISYNSDGGLSASGALLQGFLNHYFSNPQQSLPTPPPGFAERASQITGIYSLTKRGYTTYEKLLGIPGHLKVTDAGNSRLLIASLGNRPWTFIEVAPWVFHRVDGPQTVVFRPDPIGMLTFGDDPTKAFVKVPWYESPILHLYLVIVCELLFLSTLVLWPISMVRQARSKKSDTAAERGKIQASSQAIPENPRLAVKDILSRLATWLAFVLCALNVLFLIGLALFLSGLGPYPVIFRGVTPLLTMLFVLALVSAVLTVGILASTALVWRGQFWNTRRRVHYTLIALAALIFALELNYWNMLGFRI